MSGVDVVAIVAEAHSFMAASHPNYDTADKLARAGAAIAELIAADEKLDKCEAALAAHLDAMPESHSDDHWDAWASTHTMLQRELDHALVRRSTALAACKPARGVEGERS